MVNIGYRLRRGLRSRFGSRLRRGLRSRFGSRLRRRLGGRLRCGSGCGFAELSLRGLRFGGGQTSQTNNCHNVFMNHMFRFSIPVGAIYIMIFLVIIFFCIKRKPCFLSLGIWLAILLSMNMDYSLFTSETPFFLFIIYCIFFRDNATKKALS